MAIPASELVKIQPRVLAGTGQDLAFNGLFLTDNALAPADTLLKFYDAASVGDYSARRAMTIRPLTCILAAITIRF